MVTFEAVLCVCVCVWFTDTGILPCSQAAEALLREGESLARTNLLAHALVSPVFCAYTL